jgi:isoleucyl-tRNA synthetase
VGKGKDLEGLEFHHPFAGFRVPAVLADYVTLDRGTGVVTTAPGHGTEDFYTGQKYGLRVYAPLDDTGTFVEGLPEYRGKTVFEANPAIIALLRERGALLAEGKLSHSYPHCWRCHNPVVFRATEQWFIAMEADLGGGATLRQRALDEIAKVKWDPAWGEERISNMVATRPDWCISRQRVWGVPIAVFFCEPCKELLRSGEVDRAVVDLVAREGVDAWYTREAASILPPGTKCARCGGTHFRKEMDIIDVWFESGSSYLTLHQAEKDLPWPSDLYLEGGDQYRGWFHSSLLCAVGAKNQSPYKMVATNGWTLDPQGRAMSKSVGNVVDPVDIANRLGGEIVRLWVASVDFREDVRASEDLMQRIADQYRKIRNTFRFALQNLYDFDPRQDVVEFAAMQSFDQFMLLETARLADEVAHWHEEFQFHKVYQRLLKFCVVDLSALYFDVLKDRLYTHAPNSRGRRSAQTAVWRIAETLVRLFAPMMSFTVDEIWHYLPTLQGRPESVHLARFASRKEILADAVGDLDGLRAEWETLLAVREEVMRALEIARSSKLIGSGLEANLRVSAPEAIYPVLAKHADELRYLFIVSAVELERGASGNGASGIRVDVTKAPGQKCERCWNYSTRVGEDRTYPTICERCAAALKAMESSR